MRKHRHSGSAAASATSAIKCRGWPEGPQSRPEKSLRWNSVGWRPASRELTLEFAMPGALAVVHQPPSRHNPLDLQPQKMSAASIARSRGEPDLAHDRSSSRQPLRPADTPRSAAPWRRRAPFLSPQARQSTTPRGMSSLRRCRMGAGPAAKRRGEGVRWAPIRNAPRAERPANPVRCRGWPPCPTAHRAKMRPGARRHQHRLQGREGSVHPPLPCPFHRPPACDLQLGVGVAAEFVRWSTLLLLAWLTQTNPPCLPERLQLPAGL